MVVLNGTEKLPRIQQIPDADAATGPAAQRPAFLAHRYGYRSSRNTLSQFSIAAALARGAPDFGSFGRCMHAKFVTI